MTAAEAHAAAASEGLVLLRAENATGFKGVSFSANVSKPFAAKLKQGGRNTSLGCFATGEEAALAVARLLGPEGVATALTPPAPEPEPMTAAEAYAAAAEEGLSLLRAENPTGFKGVAFSDIVSKPFKASPYHGGRSRHLGYFVTAEEAALAVGRFLGPAGTAAQPGCKRPAASDGLSAAMGTNKRGKKPADAEVFVVEAEEICG